MTNNVNKLHEMRRVKAEVAELQGKYDLMAQELAPTLELIEKVGQAADAKQISRRELALGLCPELAALVAGTPARAAREGVRQRKARSVKVYHNPHNGETVETKGGNHKVLKAWKAQYGAETVESWLEQEHAAA